MPTLLKDLITIPEHVAKGDFVLKLTEGTDPAKVKLTLDSYVVTKQLAACFDESLKLVQSALQGSSKAAYLHGSFGSGKSHFMAVLNFLLGGNCGCALDQGAWRRGGEAQRMAGRVHTRSTEGTGSRPCGGACKS